VNNEETTQNSNKINGDIVRSCRETFDNSVEIHKVHCHESMFTQTVTCEHRK